MNLALYRVFLRTVATRQRVAGFTALLAVGVIVAVVLRRGAVSSDDALERATTFVDLFGLMVAVPVSALVFASAAFGDLVEDQTLVYLWLRPVHRWRLAVAAFAAAATVAVPVGVAGAALSGLIDSSAFGPGVWAAIVGSLGYTAVFLLIGLVTGRSLIWGICYLLIYEQFIARGGQSLGFLAVHSHALSILSQKTATDFTLSYFSVGTATVAPLVAVALLLGWLAWRLDAAEVA